VYFVRYSEQHTPAFPWSRRARIPENLNDRRVAVFSGVAPSSLAWLTSASASISARNNTS